MTRVINRNKGRGGGPTTNIPSQSVGQSTDAMFQGSGRNTNTVHQGSGRGTNSSIPGTGRGTNSSIPGTGRGTNSTHSGTGRSSNGRGAGRGSDALSTNLAREEDIFHDDSSVGDGYEDEPDIPVPTRRARKVCYVAGDRLVSDDDYSDATLSKIMTQIIRKSIVDNGFKWVQVPESQHKIYFDEFKKFYTWIDDDEMIRITFLRHFGRQYSRWIYRVKKARKTHGKPKALSDVGWKLFEEYWDLESTKIKSEKMVANRKSGDAKHCGGSRSNRCHKITMTKQLGREPNLFEIMKKTHLKKDGSGYIDEKSRIIDEEVTARENAAQLAATSSDGAEGELQGEGRVEVDIDKIYLDVVGVKKQRVFGAGSLSYSITSKRQKIQTSSSLVESETLRSQIVEQAKAEAKEEMKEEMEERLKEKLAIAAEEIKADLMKTILEELRNQPPP